MKLQSIRENLENLRFGEGVLSAHWANAWVCNRTVSFCESGSREPDLDMLVKLAEVFNVSVDLLLCE